MPIASLLAVVFLSAQEPAIEFEAQTRARMEEELSRFRAAHSVGYLGQAYIEITDSSGLHSGFGYLRKPLSAKGNAAKPAHQQEIVLGGRGYRPDQTLKAIFNGIPGTPDSLGWMFRLDTGRVTSYGREPGGRPERIRIGQATHDLRTREGWGVFRGCLKEIPEAYARLGPEQAPFEGAGVLMRGKDVGSADFPRAIRYFNAAPDQERVSDTAYPTGLETEFALGGSAFSGTLAQKIAARLALNPNDLPALAFKAQALCNEGKTADAEQALQAAERIRGDYFRIPLARAACLEVAKRLRDANARLDSALRSAEPEEVPGILDRIEANSRLARFDSVYAARGRRIAWVEWDVLGIGLLQALIGSSLSLHANLGPFAASISVGGGFVNVAHPPAGFPAMNFRLYAPGQRGRFYLGIGAVNPFDLGPRHHVVLWGPEAGIAHDVGEPAGFKLNYGLTVFQFLERNPPEEREGSSVGVLPHGSLVYAF